MSLKKHILGTLGTNILNIGLSLGYSILSTRLLGTEGKGEFSIFQASLDLFSLFLSLGLFEAINYFVARKTHGTREVLTTGIILSLISSAVFMGFIYGSDALGRIGLFLAEDKNTTFFWMVLLGCFWLKMIKGVLVSLLRAHLKFNWVNILSILNLAVSLLVYGILYLLELQEVIDVTTGDIFVVFLLISAFHGIFVVAVYAKVVKLGPSLSLLSKKDIITMVSWGSIAFIATSAQFLNYRIDYWFVEYFHGKTVLGLYSLASNLSLMLRIIPMAIAPVLLSYIASRGEDKEKVNVEQTIVLGRMTLTVCTFITLIGIPLSPWVIPFLYGEEFTQTGYFMQYLLLGVLPLCLTTVYASYFFGTGRIKINMYASLLGLVCTAIFDYLLIPDWGGMGAVLATIFSYIATSFYVIYQFWRINDCSIPSLLFLTKKDIQQVKQYLLHAIRRKIL